jgi:hypothetical protein
VKEFIGRLLILSRPTRGEESGSQIKSSPTEPTHLSTRFQNPQRKHEEAKTFLKERVEKQCNLSKYQSQLCDKTNKTRVRGWEEGGGLSRENK